MKTSVLVVDDSDDLATMLAMLIDCEADLTCVGQLASADALVDTIAEKQPDVVVLDLTMPGRDPLTAMDEAVVRFQGTRFVVLSGHDDPARVQDATRRGASGYVAKSADVDRILAAIRATKTR